ncbi:MiaB/RimO family radical SAM methylthiotransferase, partial [Candidatus Pelagibacter sp.]|nr:MiaB/RimO family radical SAM methylthiotransferase [Candidatus Pelagibacter sp.]
MKKKKPIIIIAGCVAQAENKEMLAREPYIDIIIGPQSYHKINDTILSYIKDKEKKEVTDFDVIEKFNYLNKIINKDSKVSSFLTIQEGCDKFCSFCVVPFTRGPEYSRPFKQIINEAKQLIKSGTKEITLIGQNVNAYSFIENKKEYKLSNLILELEKLSELKRIRYTTSHPKDMTNDLIDCYKISKKLMPVVHLPVQSGSNNILNTMNRKHTIEDYFLIYKNLKKINKDIKFSSDFIIGYPGETEKDFNDTLILINKIKFINSYSFIFSSRPGTVAAKLKSVDKVISEKRLKIIQDLLFKNQLETNKNIEGKVVDVLVENQMKDKKKLFGRTEHMTSVIFDGDKKNIG